MAGRLIWCLGMYASASTWLFNVVRQIHLARGDNDVQSHFVAGRANFGSINRLTATNLVKSHEINDEATVIDLAADADRIFVSVRDPRDAVASLMKYHGHEFDEALLLVD